MMMDRKKLFQLTESPPWRWEKFFERNLKDIIFEVAYREVHCPKMLQVSAVRDAEFFSLWAARVIA